MNKEKDFKEKAKDLMNNVEDSTNKFTKKDIEDGKTMAILSYIIPLIPFFTEKNNKYVVYHAKQGMNLFVISIAYAIINSILTSVIKVKGSCGTFWGYDLGNYCKVTPWWVTLPLTIVGIAIGVLAIIGLINAINGKAKEIPLVNKVKIFK